MTLLSVSQLGKNLLQRPVLRELSLRVESGSLVALLGPSGVGKSTLLRLIAGLLAPDEGDICFDGQSVLALPPEKRRAALVFQEKQLFPFMTVGQNIAFGLKLQGLRGASLRARIAEALEWVQLGGYEGRYPHQLSGGQAQRVALARAIAIRPRLLLLDEPLNQLDSSLRVALRQEIKTLQAQLGITTLFVTHDQQEAVALADHIALILEGTIAQMGPAQAFYESPRTAQIARFWGAKNIFPAQKQGAQVILAGQSLNIKPSPLPDGPVLVMIRPEWVQLGANGANTLHGRLQSWHYHGTHALACLRCGPLELHLSSPPYVQFSPEDSIAVHIPPEHIHLLEISP